MSDGLMKDYRRGRMEGRVQRKMELRMIERKEKKKVKGKGGKKEQCEVEDKNFWRYKEK